MVLRQLIDALASMHFSSLIFVRFRGSCLRNPSCLIQPFSNSSRLRLDLHMSSMAFSAQPRYVDIGINLADPIFRGVYHGSQRHPDDLAAVVQRAQQVGCAKFMVTGSDLKSSRDALKLAEEYPGVIYSTIGIHPCSSAIFSKSEAHHGALESLDPDPSKPIPDDQIPCPERADKIIAELKELIGETQSSNTAVSLVAFGEFGLDYDRLHYCSKTIQLYSFEKQLDLVLTLRPQLPLFLHSRACHGDFVSLLKAKFGDKLEKLEKGGVVHSFTGTVEEMRELMELGLYIGINGCSFKSAENCAVVREVELSRLMIETDGPWCEVRPSHEGYKYLIEPNPSGSGTATPTAAADARKQPKKQQKREPDVPDRFPIVKKEKWVEGAMVKGRNEPCMIERVAKIIAGIKGIEVGEVREAAWANSVKVFGLDEKMR